MSDATRALSSNPWNQQQHGSQLDADIGQLFDLDEPTIRRARLLVCERAGDATTAAELLEELGLDVALAINRGGEA